MSGGGKKTVLPPLEPPLPTPEAPTSVGLDTAEQAKAESIRRKLKARAGRRGTILTEPGTLGEPLIQHQTLLGRV